MGRQAFTRFLTSSRARSATGRRGVQWGGAVATWDELLAGGRDRARLVRPGHAYVVDPTEGLEALASLFAVASVPDTLLLWTARSALGVEEHRLAPALAEVPLPLAEPMTRPMWGVCTSGSSGRPKVAIGHADLWELVAVQHDHMLRTALPGTGSDPVLATCLPLQYSAAFLMTVLPAMFFRHDLLVFPAHDWTPLATAARDRDVAVLGVPAVVAAACLGTPDPLPMGRVAVFLGGGHVSATRVRLARERFEGVRLVNLYGTAETGAVSVDPDPGHGGHVGRPVEGKAVWVDQPNERGVGVVSAAGPDCCVAVWRPADGAPPEETTGTVRSTAGRGVGVDYGRWDAEGRLWLEGRVDGAEKVSGMLVHPRQVERHLLALPGVADARVRVEQTSHGLENLAARVVGDVSVEEVRAHCAALPDARRLTRVEVLPERDAAAAYGAHGKLT
ncbi:MULTISPECIES: AMP-binding protein [Actinoalloteichus]|uniref:AMP-binding protein n=1 Tax=Actinoalloteichus TaxID=65496 RepID=UPI001FE08A58|nr:AMP-binding protein [Actinoalloteichus spitiensis]